MPTTRPDTAAAALPDPPRAGCAMCKLRDLCLPLGLAPADLQRLETLVATRRAVGRGDYLFRSGDAFGALYAVRTGTFKTRVSTAEGRDQITGFQMAGELLGLDGIGSGQHRCDAMALEDSQVCVVPYGQLQALSHELPDLQQQLLERMSREIAHDQTMQLLLGSLHADERVAAFLLNLMQRLAERGWSTTSLMLRMTRQEIGACLGLTLETVSRCFSKLQDEGVLRVRQRQIEVLDVAALRRRVAAVGG
jgi:CRP/FNR family transcriptional regulator, anaerobic regulatory protein